MRRILLAICLVAIQTPNLFAGIVVFSDGDFDPVHWSATTGIGGTSGSQSASQGGSGGNPGPKWQVTTNSDLAVYTAHVNDTFVYDPSAGAIAGLSFNIERLNISSFSQGMGYGPLLIQGGNYYIGPEHITATVSGWQADSFLGMGANSFEKIPGSGTPNFTTSGAPITFGFYTYNLGGNTISVAYDNYQASITAVPEPTTFLLTLIGAGGVAWQRCFRRRGYVDLTGDGPFVV